MIRAAAFFVLAAVVFSFEASADEVVLGARPHYGPAMLSSMPNDAAIGSPIWMPGLDDGYDPQGLAVTADSIIVSAFKSETRSRNRGPCRVFRVGRATGAVTGQFDIPPPCGHAGGAAVTEDGMLRIADTHMLYEVPLAEAFSSKSPPLRTFPIGAPVTGGLAGAGGNSLWLGTYDETKPGVLFRFDLPALRGMADGQALTAAMAQSTMPSVTYGQGVAIDGRGKIWIARSDYNWGKLERRDLASGTVEAEYDILAATEGIAFDETGKLWAVSEAGVGRFYNDFLARQLMPFHPVIYAIDPAKLH